MPFGSYILQNMGQSCRVLKGEGAFAGAGAYEEFRKLSGDKIYFSNDLKRGRKK